MTIQLLIDELNYLGNIFPMDTKIKSINRISDNKWTVEFYNGSFSEIYLPVDGSTQTYKKPKIQ